LDKSEHKSHNETIDNIEKHKNYKTMNLLKMTLKRNFCLRALACFFILGCSEKKGEYYSNSNGAVDGYDVVAYFTDRMAVKGQPEFSYEWMKTTWYFSSAENRDAFRRSPEIYAPQYGGYCAYGTAEGHKAPTDPQAWAIVDGKLFLNYNKDVQKLWKENQEELIEKADMQWQTLRDK
jgi:YHS domain-containing protein